MRDLHVVQTPENVTFEFELAGVASRAMAWLIDMTILVVLNATLGFVMSFLSIGLGGLSWAVFFILQFLTVWWYGALLEWRWSGQTIGKKLVGIRALQLSGVRITFFQAAVRNFVRLVDFMPGAFLVGGLSALIDRRGRRLGDLAAGTLVVRGRRTSRPSLIRDEERITGFADDPAVAHAARRISPAEREALIALALRREALPFQTRQELFRRFAEHLEARLALRRPSFLSEERYVLNLAALAG